MSVAHLLPLLAARPLDGPLAWRDGQPISTRRFLDDAAALARRLPEGGPVLALTGDRYRFALALAAALQRGQFSALPPNHTPDTVARLRAAFPGLYALVDDAGIPVDLPALRFDDGAAAARAARDAGPAFAHAIPSFAPDTVVAQVMTSGSTGAPVPHPKHWGLLHTNIAAEVARLAQHMGRPSLAGVTIVGTVPPHHMYGFESTVLVALLGGAAFAAERPFFPAEVVQVLGALPRPRMLVTTPYHLKVTVESGLPLPPADLLVCATAPLSPQLAHRAEDAFAAPLMEIYGCTEAGQVATRRTTAGPEWRTFGDLRLSGNAEASVVSGGHVAVPTPLADVLEVLAPDTFRLLGRANDLINVAGKRGSLSHLNFHLNSVPGVRDGAFWLPADGGARVEDVVRLVAFVVSDGVGRERLLAELRHRLDTAFLPRRIVEVASLPRDGTGKLPAARLDAFAREVLGLPPAAAGAEGGGA